MTRRPLKAAIDNRRKFGLLQLTPVLVEALKSGELKIKSGQDRRAVVVCTSNKTFLLKKLNQSNSLLLSTPDEGKTVIFGSVGNLLEPSKGVGKIDWTGVPAWKASRSEMTLSALRLHSPCSSEEFDLFWRQKPGVEVDGHAYIVSSDIVHLVLVDIVTSLVSLGEDLTTSLEHVISVVDLPGIPQEVIRATYEKFLSQESKSLDVNLIVPWVGKFLLASHPNGIFREDFIKEWSQSLPLRFDFNLSLLEGCAVEPTAGYVQYLDSSTLSQDPRARFRQLFSIRNEWGLDQISPFVCDLVPETAKLDSWLLKYARRTRNGGSIMVTKRS